MKLKTLIIAAAAIAAFSSCKSQYELLLNSNDVDAKYEAAFNYFNEGKFSKAGSMFESLSIQTNGTERDDTVKYYWGLSNYRFRDYYTAEANLTTLIESFPRSPFTSEARYLRLDCLFRSSLRYEIDLTPTYKAITEISEYMIEYPDSPHIKVCLAMLEDLNGRLDEKAYEAARLYYKMEDYKASRVAFRNVLKDDAENIFREDILYYIAMSSYNFAHNSIPSKQRERYLTFVDDYYNFIGEIPESHYRRELDNVYRKAQKALGRDVAAADEDKTERDFAKERRKLQKEARKAEKN